MRRFRLLTVVGARPQFVKAAAIGRALAGRDAVEDILLHTGQHFDNAMSRVFFDELGIAAPRVNLGIHGGNHGEMTGRMLAGIEQVILAERPDLVLVPGDTNSTLAGALAAAKLGVPVAHLEAGLRSYNRAMPEEVNRVLTDHVSAMLFCPTDTAVTNLAREGISKGVHQIGDVMYDAALFTASRPPDTTLRKRLGLGDTPYALATLHRAENTHSRDKLEKVITYLREQAGGRPLVLPLHPRTRAAIEQWGLPLSPIVICDPLGYLDMQQLVKGAVTIYTDSGGLQKEAYFHRVPCVTLRSETEWIETVACGWNRLWQGTDYMPRRDIAAYGDGHAAERAIDLIVDYLECRATTASRPSS